MSEQSQEKNESTVCGLECEVYSRVVGYYRPLQDWNIGKKEEFADRKTFDAEKALREGRAG